MFYIILSITLFIIVLSIIILLVKTFKPKQKAKQNPPDSVIHRNIIAVGSNVDKVPRCPVCMGKNPRTQNHCSLCGFGLYYLPDDFIIVAYRYYRPEIREVYQFKRMERFVS